MREGRDPDLDPTLTDRAPEVVLKADADLASLENDGWTRSMTTYSATFNHETHRVEYARMVELKRAVKADPLMAAVEEMLADMEARAEVLTPCPLSSAWRGGEPSGAQ